LTLLSGEGITVFSVAVPVSKENTMNESNTIHPGTITFAVHGMNCGSCVRHIEEAIQGSFPTATTHVDLAAKQVTVIFEHSAASGDAIAKVLEAEGYPARPV
jgi:copper chaperone CopZ